MKASSVPEPASEQPTPGAVLRIGELLVRDGHATPRRSSRRSREQERSLPGTTGRRLGEILVAARVVTSRQVALALALANQYALEFVDLAQIAVEPRRRPPAGSLAHEHQVLPVRLLSDDLVQVAVADPTNLRTADDLRLALGLNCSLAVADAGALNSTIGRTYRLNVS